MKKGFNMKLHAENVVTMARADSQHMRTNSGDAVFLFTYEGLLRFADGVAAYTLGVMPRGYPAPGPEKPLPTGDVMGDAIAKAHADVLHLQNIGVFQKTTEQIWADQKTELESVKRQLEEMAVSHGKVSTELKAALEDGKRFKDESEKIYDELQQFKGLTETYKTAYESSQEELRKEASVSFDLRRKLDQSKEAFRGVEIAMQGWKEI